MNPGTKTVQVKRRLYVRPGLKVYGNVERITRGGVDGDFTDRDFPDNTPKSQLTFSEN